MGSEDDGRFRAGKRRNPSLRRRISTPSGTRRNSLIQPAVDAAKDVVAMLIEPHPQKQVDPEDEPGFAERNPRWEDDLPQILPNLNISPAVMLKNISNKKELPLIPIVEKKRHTESLATQRWKRAYFAAKRILEIRNQSTRSSLGTGAQLDGRSFGIWDKYSPSRVMLFQALYNRLTEYILLVLTIAHVAIIVVKATERGKTQPSQSRMESLDRVDAAFSLIFSIECVGRIACLGLIKGPNAYLKNVYNKIDLLAVLDSWCHLIAALFFKRYVFIRFAVFRLFRTLLSLRDIEFFAQVLAIFEALERSMGPLQDVFLLTLVLLYFFALTGLQFFADDLTYRCVRSKDLQMSYPPLYCSRFKDRGSKCPGAMVCKNIGGNPGFGVQTFDIIPYSFLTLFQVITLEGWSDIMHNIKHVEYPASVLYFMVLIVLVAYLIINIVVAAISGVFLRVRHEHQALLKRSKAETRYNFYNATVLATVLKDVVLDNQTNQYTSCADRFRVRSDQMRARVSRAFSKSFSLRRMDSSIDERFDWDPEGRTMLSRRFSRSFSRALSRNVSARVTAAKETLNSKCEVIFYSKAFRCIECFAIIANMVVLCTYYEGMPDKLVSALHALEAIFVAMFIAEMVVRYFAVQFTKFFASGMNLFDMLVVGISVGSIVSQRYPNISGVRMLRLFYSEKKETGKHRSLVTDCIEGLGAMSVVAFFYLLIVFIYGAVGLELYAGEFYNFYDGYPRTNFDTIFASMFLFFTVSATDSWEYQMYNAMRSEISQRWIAPFLFVSFIIIVVFLVLNLIIAVILEKIELTDGQKKEIQKAEYLKDLQAQQKRLLSSKGSGTWVVSVVEGASKWFRFFSGGFHSKDVTSISLSRQNTCNIPEQGFDIREPKAKVKSLKGIDIITVPGQPSPPTLTVSQSNQSYSMVSTSTDVGSTLVISPGAMPPISSTRRMSNRSTQILTSTGFARTLPNRSLSTSFRVTVATLVKQEENATNPAALEEQLTSFVKRRDSFEIEEYEQLRRSFSNRLKQPWYLSESALYLFSNNNPARKIFQRIVGHRFYNYVTIPVVMISVAVMVAEGQMLKLSYPMYCLNIFVYTVFVLEFLSKIIANGFLLTPDPYLGDAYNILDMILLLFHTLYFIPNWSKSQKEVIFFLSAFRPLRFLGRLPGLRKLTAHILRTIPAIMSVFGFTVMVFAFFAYIGVYLFRGRFGSCTDDVGHRIECVGNYLTDDMVLGPRVWSNMDYHFDDFPSAMLSLFVLSTFDNMQSGFIIPSMDIYGPKGTQPQTNMNTANALYFIIFTCIGGFFMLRMFVSVFIDQFGLISGSKLLTQRQKLLRDTNRIIQNMKPLRTPRVPKFAIRRFCHRIVTSKYYGSTVRIVILINYFWLSTHYAKQPSSFTVHRNRIEASFASLYCLDILIKMIGLEVRDFIEEPWNLFELGNAIVSETMVMPDTLSLRKTIGRIPMGFRIFRLIRYTPRLNTLLHIVFASMLHILDVFWLLGILMIIFASMGAQMFAHVREGRCVSGDISFNGFVNSFVTLFQIMTGDNWSCVLKDVQVEFPFCSLESSHYGSDCGKAVFAVFYFLIFIILATNIFMNMFVAVIVDTITFGLLKENTIVTPMNLTDYQLLWKDPEFDPWGNGFIGLHKLRSFVNRLGIPLGRRHNAPAQWYARIEWEVLGFHVAGKGVPFRELLETLTLYKIGSRGLELTVRIEREKQVQTTYRNGAAIKIQAAIKGFLVRCKPMEFENEDTATVKNPGKHSKKKKEIEPEKKKEIESEKKKETVYEKNQDTHSQMKEHTVRSQMLFD